MNKKMKIIIWILIILILVLILFVMLKNFSKDNEKFYSIVEQYIVEQEKTKYFLETKDSEPNYDISDFQVFRDIARLGVKQKGDETYVYVWALVKSYYVQNEELITNEAYSIPYKFIIKNNEIVDYKIPMDGEKYTNSIKEIFPIDIRIKFDSELVDENKIKEQVEKHYSYLENL